LASLDDSIRSILRKENAKGRARVAKDGIDTTDLKEMEAERSALEELALADFAAESGIVMESDTPVDDAPAATEDEKTM